METRWMYRTSGDLPELREEAKNVCVIPMGCIEKHGLHLPLGTDVFQASRVSYDASQRETVCVGPDFIFGDVPERNAGLPVGSIGISLELEMRMLEEYCDMVYRSGFNKIIIFNAHGGNRSWLSTFLRYLSGKKKDYVVMEVFIKLPVPHVLAQIILEKGSGAVPGLTTEDEELLLRYHAEGMELGHACMSETAFVMHYLPETVHLERLGKESGINLHKTDYLTEAGIRIRDNGWGINYPFNFSGNDPIGCNERIAAAAAEWEINRVAGIFKLVKEDENLLRWQAEYNKDWKEY